VTLLSAQTSVALPNPRAVVDAFHEHFAEYMTITRDGEALHFEADYGNGTLSAEGGRFAARVSCISENVLLSVKSMVAEHILEFSGEKTLDFRWEGHGAELRELPNLFTGRVVRGYNLTPKMRRLVIAIDKGIERLMTGGFHVRILIIPDQASTPVWPHLSKTGAIVWPEGENELTRRVYTIRSGDIQRGEIDIDFVMHEGNDMPGAHFGATAAPGDIVGIVGPGGELPDAETYVFAGDETALPVMLRMAAEMPAGKALTVYAEIDNEAERQEMSCKADVTWNWLYRHGKHAGTAGLLEHAMRNHAWAGADGLHVFVGCEKGESRLVKKMLGDEFQIPKTCIHTAGYWVKGANDDH
jgi:NADPH-dependent ferric siderophore reductase